MNRFLGAFFALMLSASICSALDPLGLVKLNNVLWIMFSSAGIGSVLGAISDRD